MYAERAYLQPTCVLFGSIEGSGWHSACRVMVLVMFDSGDHLLMVFRIGDGDACEGLAVNQ